MTGPDYVAVDPRHEAFTAMSHDPANVELRAQTLATIYVGDQLKRIADSLESLDKYGINVLPECR